MISPGWTMSSAAAIWGRKRREFGDACAERMKHHKRDPRPGDVLLVFDPAIDGNECTETGGVHLLKEMPVLQSLPAHIRHRRMSWLKLA
jgi:hypothetical protein